MLERVDTYLRQARLVDGDKRLDMLQGAIAHLHDAMTEAVKAAAAAPKPPTQLERELQEARAENERLRRGTIPTPKPVVEPPKDIPETPEGPQGPDGIPW